MLTRVKICGLTGVGDALQALAAGADMLGVHFCASPRRVPLETGRAIADAVGGRAELVGVFIDPSAEELEEATDQLALDWVQLHGEEPFDLALRHRVIKALKVKDGVVPAPGPWPDPILLDTWSANRQGGSGRSWDFAAAAGLVGARRVILAGGLTGASVGQVVRELRPWGVDVSSGVESRPGVKDAELMRRFVDEVRLADAGS